MTERQARIAQLTSAFHEGIKHAEWVIRGLQQVLDSHKEGLALAQSLADVPGRGVLIALAQRGVTNLETAIKNERDRITHIQGQVANLETDV